MKYIPSFSFHFALGFCFAFLLTFAPLTWAQTAGTVEAYNPSVPDGNMNATAVQPDGKIIIGGSFTQVGSTAMKSIARINVDGSVDTSFTPPDMDEVFSVAVQADGKIVVGGYFTTVGGVSRNYIARLNADGSLDTSFDPGTGGDAGPYCLRVQPDGKILLGGWFNQINGTLLNRIARLNTDGSVDTSFSPGGGTTNSSVGCLGIQADGKLVLGGQFTTFNGTAANYIVRVNADGSVDTGFNPGSGADGPVSCVAVQADGKLVLGGSFTSFNGTAANHIVRLNADGTRDSTFGSGLSGANDLVESVALQADGKILLGGSFTTLNGTSISRIARFNADGSLDTSFNTGGGADGPLQGVTVQADGKVVLNGRFGRVNGTNRSKLARLANDTATQRLAPPDATRVLWTRGGSSPEVSHVTFDLSTDGGNTWTALGGGTRVGTTANWQLTGLSLPASGHLRARGRTNSGDQNGCAGLVEAVLNFPPPPDITSVSPASGIAGTSVTITGLDFTGATGVTFGGVAATNVTVVDSNTITCTTPTLSSAGPVSVLVTTQYGTNPANTLYSSLLPPSVTATTTPVRASDTTIYITGSNFDATTPGNNTVMFSPAGSGTVTAATATRLTVTSVSGLSIGPLSAVVTDTFGNSGAAVQVATVVTSLPGDLDLPLDAVGPVGVGGTNVNTTVALPDGRMIITGSFSTVGGVVHTSIARLNADGSVDNTFTASANNFVYSVVVQADGKLVLGGNFTSVNGSAVSTTTGVNRIARLNADGTRDTAFNSGLGGANNTVYSLAMQADGKLVLGGNFTSVNGSTRSFIARMINDAATQSLTAPSLTQIMWMRGGTSPEVSQVTFEQSTDGGTVFTPLGSATRVGSTPNWQLTGLSLPATGILRARGRSISGEFNGSSGLVESVTPYSFVFPDIAVRQTTALTDGVGSVDFGTVTMGGSSSALTFTVTDPGTADLTSLAITKDGTNAGDFSVSELSGTTVPASGGSVTFTVTFTPSASGARSAAIHIGSNVTGAKNPFDIVLTGTAQTVFTQWALANGVPTDPTALGGANLQAFAFGLTPGSSSGLVYGGTFAGGVTTVTPGMPITALEPTTNGVDFRSLFTRRRDYIVAGLTYTPQFSADLVNWVNSTATPTVLADDGVNQIVSVPFPANVGKKKARFFRVSISTTP